ncbi:cytochrome c oxidase subunit II [Steroidobacter flavus]|uniref:Cytochrome aa3 subunit 2 n=1 Tax=Steroidobacter flavus TaxID=1842136 RepID=A0ABV8T425_9GAMM
MIMRKWLATASLWTGCMLAGCDGPQNYMQAGGPAAAKLASIGAFTLILFSLVSIVVLLLLLWVAVRRRGTLESHAPIDADGGQRWILVGGIAVPVAVLATVFVSSLQAMSHYPMSHQDGAAADIRVTGRQWWFNAEYLGHTVHGRVNSPTEIHIPVGRPVDIELVTRDVIHSFWIPKLHGKVDLVPGMTNRIRIRADEPGVFSGECGEFCGAQHANMRLQVVAQSAEEFDRWLRDQRANAREPQTSSQKIGQQVFMSAACALCHTVRGTPALGQVGPDLTHVASRGHIAGGMLPNNRGTLTAWVSHAQELKPGSRMPDLPGLTGEQLIALSDYLQSLE